MLKKNKIKPVIIINKASVYGSSIAAQMHLIQPDSEVRSHNPKRYSEGPFRTCKLSLLTSRLWYFRVVERIRNGRLGAVSLKITDLPGRIDSRGYRLGALARKQYSTDSRFIQKGHNRILQPETRSLRACWVDLRSLTQHQILQARSYYPVPGPNVAPVAELNPCLRTSPFGGGALAAGVPPEGGRPSLFGGATLRALRVLCCNAKLAPAAGGPPPKGEVRKHGLRSELARIGSAPVPGPRKLGPELAHQVATAHDESLLRVDMLITKSTGLKTSMEFEPTLRAYSVIGELNTTQKRCLQKFINLCMKHGKKNKSYKIISNTLQRLSRYAPNNTSATAVSAQSFEQKIEDSRFSPATKGRQRVSTRRRQSLLVKAIENVKPIIEVKKVRISGTTQLVPYIIPKNRQICLALRWIIEAAILRRNTKKSMTIDQCFFAELIDASQNIGTVRKRRDDLHKLAESNRGFAHYRW